MMHRRRLDLRDVLQLRDDVLDHAAAFVDVGHFSAAEGDRYQDFVLVREELAGAVHLDLDVVVAGLGADADLFDLDLMPGALVLPLLLLVLELAVVHDAADGGPLSGRDFHQVQVQGSRPFDGVVR